MIVLRTKLKVWQSISIRRKNAGNEFHADVPDYTTSERCAPVWSL
jgi:hypothetical protein